MVDKQSVVKKSSYKMAMLKIRACYLVITIMILQHLPRYYSTSSVFQTLSTQCRTIITELSPCADYIRDAAAMPEHVCCSGVHNVARLAKNRSDVEAICTCLRQGLDGTSYDPIKVQRLPKLCRVAVTFPIVNSNTNCAQ